MTGNNSRRPLISVTVFVAGLISAVASGVVAYRQLGFYGGPVSSGYFREWNEQTRRYELIHETTKGGLKIRSRLSAGRNRLEPEPRAGFSTLDDGVIDAWLIRDLSNGTSRIEVSTKRDGKIDRWEHYIRARLTRVELDTTGNGKADRWMTYEDGILMETFIDADEDGKPDSSP